MSSGQVHLQNAAAPRAASSAIVTSAGNLVPRSLSHGGDMSARRSEAASRPHVHDEDNAGVAKAIGAAKSGRELRHFAAGGCGGLMGALITCPLEVVKTHLQSKNVIQRKITDIVMHISRTDGVLGFWRGIGPMLAGVVPARAVNFWTYNAVKGHLLSAGYENGPVVHMTGGIMAGVITVTVVNPIWVIKTRLQLQGLPSVQAGLEAGGARAAAPGAVVYRGSWHALTQILREEGVRGLYKGLIPSIWGVSETAIQFVLYERLKSMIAARTLQQQHVDTHRACPAPSSSSSTSAPQTELRNLEYIAAAASAKVVASCATYPHEVIRTRLRERGASQIYSSALHCVRRVWVEEGMRGMYGGLFTHLLRVVPNTAILFFTYEKVAKLLTVE